MARRPAQTQAAGEGSGPAWTNRLVGHESAEQAYLQTLRSGRMPHAWMITGAKGVGKATLAYRMARHLLVEDLNSTGVGLDLLGGATLVSNALDMEVTHPIFRQVALQSHPDFRVLQRTANPKTGKLRSEIVIEDVRDVIEFLRLKPALGGWRVVIVDSADEMNRNAANALLKILEEPPAQSVLILLSHAPRSLLPTIISRCSRISLQPLPRAAIEKGLVERFPDMEGKGEIELLAQLAEGSLGNAIRIAEANGGELFKEMTEVLRTWPKLDSRRLHGLADRMAGKNGEAVFDMANEMLAWWFGRFFRYAARRELPPDRLFSDEDALIQRMQQGASLDRWLQLWEKANRTLGRVRRVNLDRKQAWIVASLILLGGPG